jgi:hypothetical protein
MSYCVKDIAAIIDMDGFSVNGKFLSKELGFLKVGDATAQSFFFDISLRWRDLTPKDLRTCKYVQTRIHKLPFGVPAGIDAIPLSALKETVRNLYCNMRKNSLLAYKGGNYEKNLLADLNIPSVNIECFGCPKAQKLFGQMIWLETCGKHLTIDAYQHCPKVEVEAYGLWLEKQL